MSAQHVSGLRSASEALHTVRLFSLSGFLVFAGEQPGTDVDCFP